MTKTPLVSICCIAYNQEKFIRETLDSFLRQETNFEYEILVNDDCSTDKTAQILREYQQNYPDIFNNFYQTQNQYSQGFKPWYYVLFPEAKGKYIAICDGDDYWTDPHKLQKQIDFLEANQDFSITWCKFKYLVIEDKKTTIKKADWEGQIPQNQDIVFNFDNIFRPYCTYTLTAVFRNDIDINFLKKLKYSKDNSLYVHLLTKGKGVLLDFYGGLYRIHEGGVYSKKNLFFQRYTSFLNLEEIMHHVKAAQTDNLISIRNSLLKDCLKLANSKSPNYAKVLRKCKKHLGNFKTSKILFKKLFR